MLRLPFAAPAAYVGAAGIVAALSDVDVGGYDFMIGGHGFRLATDQQMPYARASEPTTAHRFDSSLEPGEQTLNELPWVKSQSSFHAGAGQLNLEQGFTAFQYQQEQVEHIRFDASIGIDCWTPGALQRLPDTKLTGLGFTPALAVTAAISGIDYAIVAGATGLSQVAWNSGPDATPTINSIDLTGATFGGASNCTVTSLATDGTSYYALVQLSTASGTYAGVKVLVITGAVNSTAAPVAAYNTALTASTPGVIGWVKERPILGLGRAVYELDPAASAGTALPVPKYTHPLATRQWVAISESPSAILIAGTNGYQSTVQSFELDTSGATPTLTGGATIATMPTGEQVTSLASVGGSSFLAIGTTLGIRIATFDTYTGALKYGPITLTSTSPVTAMTGRDRFVYCGYDNQQQDGTTGLARIDLSMVVDQAERYAWASDLRPPTTAPTGRGHVASVGILPKANRIIFFSPDGVHVEGPGPGNDGDAWLRTSRIRYDTSELKLFTLGRVHGTLNIANISVVGICPFTSDTALGTFGFIASGDPGEFSLPAGTHEWLQLKFDLVGSGCILNSYQVKALPAPRRQHIIQFTANCFRNETDRFGLDVTDPEIPRQRLRNVRDLESLGDEVRYVEFTNSGAVAELVVIDQIIFQSYSRPGIEDDFGGYVTFKLRATGG